VKTISATEFEPCTEAEIRNCCDEVVNGKLPFFVAVAKNHRPKCRTGYLSERIIGYVNLNDHVNRSSMHRYTFELDLFVDPGYVRQGIGKCLLDKMMEYAHPNYPARGGYEYVNDYEYLKTGEKRIVKTILISYHYERDENVSWVSEYLRPFGFLRAGNFHMVGFKDGKVVDKVMFQQQTSEKINAHLRPIVPGAH
jgi:L-amino acid N-acyltransferase YncA